MLITVASLNFLIFILDDQFLITFLRGCKFSIQKAKEKIDLFFTVREEIPELIRNRDPLGKRMGAMIKLGYEKLVLFSKFK